MDNVIVGLLCAVVWGVISMAHVLGKIHGELCKIRKMQEHDFNKQFGE